MTLVVAVLCWFLVSVPAALILGRMLVGTAADDSPPLVVEPGPTARERLIRS